MTNCIEIPYGPVMFAAKYSVLRQIEQIFTGTRKDYIFWWARGLIWANLAFDLAIFIACIAACVPREKTWNLDPTISGTCLNSEGLILATSAMNILSDWSAFLLPLFAIRRLKMGNKAKIGVAAIFATALLYVAA